MIVERVSPQRMPETEAGEISTYRVYFWGITEEGFWDATVSEYEISGLDFYQICSWAAVQDRLESPAFTVYATETERNSFGLLILSGIDPAPDERDDPYFALGSEVTAASRMLLATPALGNVGFNVVDPRDVQWTKRPTDYVLTSTSGSVFRLRETNALETMEWGISNLEPTGFSLSVLTESPNGLVGARLMKLMEWPSARSSYSDPHAP